jgi:hypothetical protein
MYVQVSTSLSIGFRLAPESILGGFQNALCRAGKVPGSDDHPGHRGEHRPSGILLCNGLPHSSYDFSMTYEGPSGPAFGNILAAKQLSGIFNLAPRNRTAGEM